MNLRISDLMAIQQELQAAHPEWGGVPPEIAREQLLWGIGELGEVIDIIKKRGDNEIMNSPEPRRHFVEEMADVIMYLTDVLLCYGISAGEYCEIHTCKHAHNMKRDWAEEIAHKFDKNKHSHLNNELTTGGISMNLRISDLIAMQNELQAAHPNWGGVTPERGRNQLLWSVCELGEVIDIIKKRGDDEIMNNPETRHHFVEEMADVMMYLTDVMLCYGITAEEYSEVHARKHAHNMKRNWTEEIAHMFDDKE